MGPNQVWVADLTCPRAPGPPGWCSRTFPARRPLVLGFRPACCGRGQRRFLLDVMTLQDFADDPDAGVVTEENVCVGRKHV